MIDRRTLLAAAAGTAAAAALVRPASAGGSPAVAAESRFVDVKGGTIAYRRFGAGKPLLFLQRFRGGIYAAFRSDYRDLVAGADAIFLGDHLEVGLNWERRIGGPYAGQAGAGGPNRAAAYVRQILKPGSSMYLPAVMYQDGFLTYQDNFLPFVRNPAGQRWNRLTMAGYHYRLNLYTPYWDPECGVWVDAMAGGGA